MTLFEYLEDKLTGTGKKARFAEDTGITPATVSRWIGGKTEKIKFENCLTIAAHFEKDPVAIFEMAGKPKWAEVYLRSVAVHKPQNHKPTEADIYPPNHAETHRALEDVLRNDGPEAKTLTGLIGMLKTKAELEATQGALPEPAIAAAAEVLTKKAGGTKGEKAS